MILDEGLIEKYKTQKRLSANSKNIHDYFQKAKQASRAISHQYGFHLQYKKQLNRGNTG